MGHGKDDSSERTTSLAALMGEKSTVQINPGTRPEQGGKWGGAGWVAGERRIALQTGGDRGQRA